MIIQKIVCDVCGLSLSDINQPTWSRILYDGKNVDICPSCLGKLFSEAKEHKMMKREDGMRKREREDGFHDNIC